MKVIRSFELPLETDRKLSWLAKAQKKTASKLLRELVEVITR